MSEKVIVIGASGHGKVVADAIQKAVDVVLGFLDDNEALPKFFVGFPLLGTVADFEAYRHDARFIIAVGNAAIRERIAKQLTGVAWYTAIHPAATIANLDVRIGEGTVILANAVVNAGSVIGKHCIINTSAVVEHDNFLEDYAHVSVGAKLAGTVRVGKATWIGIGASVRNNLTICDNCMIGAGAVVVKEILHAGTYVGCPAKRLRSDYDMEKK